MNSENQIVNIAGVLLIVQMITAILSYSVILDPILYGSKEFLLDVDANSTQVRIAALLDFTTTIAYLGVAVLLFPILKQYSERIALWFFAMKLSEFVTYVMGVIFLLTMLSISKEYMADESSETTSLLLIGKYIRSARVHTLNLNLLAYCFGTSFFFYLLFKSRLVPRFLSIWGMLAVIGILTDILVSIFGYSNGDFMYVLMMPMGLCELFLGFWLIIKGFRTAQIDNR